MLYLNSYIRQGRPQTFLESKGSYLDCLVTCKDSTEFKSLIEQVEHPIYGINGYVSLRYGLSSSSQEQPRFKLSGDAVENIYTGVSPSNLVVTRKGDSKSYEGRNICSPEFLIIPLFYSNVRIGKAIEEANRYTRDGRQLNYIQMNKAEFYSKEQPDGYVDPMLMEEPMNILSGESSKVVTCGIATTTEINNALWKLRNKIKIRRVYTSKNDFWKQMFTTGLESKDGYFIRSES